MDVKNSSLLSRLLVIFALFLGVLSLILPWSQIAVGALGKLDFYCWGISGISILGYADPTTELYVSFLLNEDFISLLSETGNFYGYLVPMIFGVLVLPLVGIGLFFCALSVFNVAKKKMVFVRYAGIVMVVSVILYYIFMQFGLLSLLNSGYIAFTNFFSYSVGYVLMILAVILLGVSYIMLRLFGDLSVNEGESSDDPEVMKLLKQRYVKGEITKEEYDQMKKDIE